MSRSVFISIAQIFTGFFFAISAVAQPTGLYDQHAVFDPEFMAHPVSAFRSADGAPSSDYWQNRANYIIKATLDIVEDVITGDCEITYTNNSPDKLYYLWLQLDQNLYRNGSTGGYSQGAPAVGGYELDQVKLVRNGKEMDARYIVTDTRMQIRLDQPLESHGGRILIDISYHFKIDAHQFRLGIGHFHDGSVYDVAQWYPRMCVYDDVRGWNVLPYQGSGEFYCEYGNFDFSITVPWDMIVVASGELENPDEVLTKQEIDRLGKARESDRTTYIIAPSEVAKPEARPVKKGLLTWHYKMGNSRDVSWAASRAFVWDAARINLPEGKKALAMSVYPKECMGANAWDRATEYLKKSVETFSSHWFSYPYPVAVNVGGPVGGMEYPGLIFCSSRLNTAKRVYYVTAHEIGHTWFPMIVGSNERRYAFMDEGFNTFIDIYAQEEFNNGEFGPKRDGEFDPAGNNPARDFVPYMVDTDAERIINYADVMQGKFTHPVSYYKTSLGLVLLREYILGNDRFDYAFRTYIRQWAYKHPTPEDFFRTMNNASGEELNWFWNEWFYQTWTLDQAVQDVKYVDGDPAKGALITLLNNDRMAMPATVKVVEQNGKATQLKLPVEIWQHGGTYTLRFTSKDPIVSVTVDPDKQLPDNNPDNNEWKAQ